MNKGGTVEAHGLKVTMTHADHSGGDIYAAAESPIYLGEAVGHVVELENGLRFCHAGDTRCSDELRAALAERRLAGCLPGSDTPHSESA